MFVSLAVSAVILAVVQAADRTEIGFADGRVFPESLTSTPDGTLSIGSMELGSVYRATPRAGKHSSTPSPSATARSDKPILCPATVSAMTSRCRPATPTSQIPWAREC